MDSPANAKMRSGSKYDAGSRMLDATSISMAAAEPVFLQAVGRCAVEQR